MRYDISTIEKELPTIWMMRVIDKKKQKSNFKHHVLSHMLSSRKNRFFEVAIVSLKNNNGLNYPKASWCL